MGEAFSKADLSMEKVLYALVITAVGIIVIRLLMLAVGRLLRRSRLDDRIKKILRGALRGALIFVLVIIVLGYLNVEVSSLVALLSVAALAVSLALQNLLSNVAGGLLLLSTKPFNIGDFVEAGGVMGTVAETGIFYTKLNSIDNRVIQIPNSELSSGKIINYSAEETRRIDIKVNASYDAPVERVRACLEGVLEAEGRVLPDLEHMARVNGYGESAIEYIVRFWCANRDYWDVYFDVLEAIKAAFDREGIGMTYNHLNVHMMPEGRQTPPPQERNAGGGRAGA